MVDVPKIAAPREGPPGGTLTRDEQDDLAARGAAGDRDAAGRAIGSVAGLVRWRVRRSSMPQGRRREAADDAFAALALALPRYDPRRGRFTTFAVSVVRWRLAQSRRRHSADRRAVPLSAVRTGRDADRGPTFADAADAADADPAQAAADRTDAAALWARLGGLPDRQRAAVSDWANGVPAKATAAAWGVTPSAVSQAKLLGLAALRRAA